MKKGRFCEEQIIGILKRHEAGQKVADRGCANGWWSCGRTAIPTEYLRDIFRCLTGPDKGAGQSVVADSIRFAGGPVPAKND
jgi:hypothetical protein